MTITKEQHALSRAARLLGMKPIWAWAGVCDDAIEVELWPNTANDGYCRLYRTKKEALKHYEQAVRVLVIAADDPEAKS